MNICILTHTLPRNKKDTSAPFIGELAESLVKLGNKVVVVAPFDTEFEYYNRPYKVITYKYIWPKKLHKSGYSRVLGKDNKINLQMKISSTFMSFFALVKLIHVIRKEKIDIVSAHWVIPNGFIAFLGHLLTRVPYTITIPGSDVYLSNKNIFFKTTFALACNNSSYVLSDSEHYFKQAKTIKTSKTNHAVVRYGVNPERFKYLGKNPSLLKNLGISKQSKVVLCVGRFVEKKGFKYLIEALPEIISVFPDTVLVMVGDGEQKEDYIKYIKRLKIQDKVMMLGKIPYSDLPNYYNLADCLVMPSVKDEKGNIDASPVAMMDALMCGIPVVATKYSASPELMLNNKIGHVVDEKNPNEISTAVVKILKARNTKTTKSYIRKIAIKNFSTDAVGKKYNQIFSEIIEAKNS